MIIENNPVSGLKSELNALDSITTALGFVRWQWEYDRATYDFKMVEASTNSDYYLRIDTRCIESKLEKPYAVLELHQAYIGRATFPHGLDYNSPIPAEITALAAQKLDALKQLLESDNHSETETWKTLYSSTKDELAQVKKERDELLSQLGNK